MNILLVQVPTSHLGAGERVYPLGLARLSSRVPPHYHKSVLDMNLYPDPWPELRQRLSDSVPDIVALSFRNLDPLAGHMTSYLSSLKTAAALVRKSLPHARILAGGPAFSLFGKRLMSEIPQIDFGLVGEGESVFPLLLKDSFVPQAVPGLIWKKSGRPVWNQGPVRMPMDELPPMDLDAFPVEPYTEGNLYVAAIGIEGKRGCALNCGYCVYPCLGGSRMRVRNPQNIVDEMEMLHRDHGIHLFHFTDSVINMPADHFAAVCDEILRRGLHVGWTGFFRETHLSTALLDKAVRAGLAAVYFSADALTDHGLKLLNKRMTRTDILDAARLCARNGILTMCHFLVNLPGETAEHRTESLAMIDRILDIHAAAGNLGAVIFNTVRLYPNAPLTTRLLKSGQLDPEIDLLYPTYYNPQRSAHILHELEARCHLSGVLSRLSIENSMEKIPA